MTRKGIEYESMDSTSNSKYVFKELDARIRGAVEKSFGLKNPNLVITPAPKRTGTDYGVQLGTLSKELGSSPKTISEKIAKGITETDSDTFEDVSQEGPYLNIRINMATYAPRVINQVLEMGNEYGKENIGKGAVVIVDESSPNIAKRMSYGHLRSTIIGDSISNILEATGYKVIRDNHIGDWGTQFGKLIVAIKRWGDEKKITKSKDPIGVLQDLYVKFHEEAETESKSIRSGLEATVVTNGINAVPNLSETIDQIGKDIMKRKKISKEQLDNNKILQDALDRVSESHLEKEGREWFLKLERGDPEARRLWKLCIDLSMKEFQQIYDFLGIKFDVILGESFYEGMLKDAVEEVKRTGAGTVSEGALVVDLEDQNLGTALIQKSDGASLYMTRDIATAIYREHELGAKKAVYVVGEDQKHYFQQLFAILQKMGHPIGRDSVHIYFGMVSLPEGKMSTRKGRVILLKDVISEGLKKTDALLKEKNPELYKNNSLRNEVVKQITVGAIKWNDLSQDPRKAVVFKWDKALNLEGNSAPYVQYQAVRANKLISLAADKLVSISNVETSGEYPFQEDEERDLVKALAEFPDVLASAEAQYSPTKVANYVFALAQKFSSFYDKIPVLKSEDSVAFKERIRLVAATSQVITNSLNLLGIEVPVAM